MASKGPNLKAYLDKTIALHLNKGRRVTGTLRGYDQFMNIVLGDAVEETSGAGQNRIGMVVIRGNSIVQVHLSGRPLAFDPLFPCRCSHHPVAPVSPVPPLPTPSSSS